MGIAEKVFKVRHQRSRSGPVLQ